MAAEKTMKQESQAEEAAKSVQEAWRELKASMRAFLPEEFWRHRRAARREMLLAARSLIDARIEHLEQEEAPQRKGAKKIKVE